MLCAKGRNRSGVSGPSAYGCTGVNELLIICTLFSYVLLITYWTLTGEHIRTCLDTIFCDFATANKDSEVIENTGVGSTGGCHDVSRLPSESKKLGKKVPLYMVQLGRGSNVNPEELGD